MEVEGVASPEPLIDVDEAVSPAPGADEQKPNEEPAPDADVQKTDETPEKQEARKESRRARQARQHAIELGEARAEARILREQLSARQPQPESGEPQREGYPDYETYLRAVAKYDAAQVVKADREASQKQAEQGKATEAHVKATQAWVEREKAFEAATPDYKEVVESYLEDIKEDFTALSKQAREFIAEAGAPVLYQLANSTELQDRIAALSPYRQVAELGKLDVEAKPPVKTASNAPAPIKPVGQGRSAGIGYRENMSQAEYEKWRSENGNKPRWAH